MNTRFLFTVLGLLYIAVPLQAEQIELPETPNTQARLRLLSAIQRDYPELFSYEREYHANVDAALQNQSALVDNLKRNRQYRQLSQERPEAVEMTFRSGSTTLHLEEVPPHVGLLRGFCGNDCATLYSPNYSWSPSERVFFIRDRSKKLIGYAAGTMVEGAATRPTFYLHTIQGPEINGPKTAILAQGFSDVARQLGASNVRFPTEHRRDQNINFDPIKNKLTNILGESETAISPTDGEIRAIIDGTVQSSHYDSARVNTRAVKLTESGYDVETEVVRKPFRNPRLADNADLLRFAVELRKTPAHNQGLLQALIPLIPNGETKIAHLESVIANPHGLGRNPYKVSVREAFANEGIEVGDDWFESRKGNLLADGFAKSRGENRALNVPNRQESNAARRAEEEAVRQRNRERAERVAEERRRNEEAIRQQELARAQQARAQRDAEVARAHAAQARAYAQEQAEIARQNAYAQRQAAQAQAAAAVTVNFVWDHQRQQWSIQDQYGRQIGQGNQCQQIYQNMGVTVSIGQPQVRYGR